MGIKVLDWDESVDKLQGAWAQVPGTASLTRHLGRRRLLFHGKHRASAIGIAALSVLLVGWRGQVEEPRRCWSRGVVQLRVATAGSYSSHWTDPWSRTAPLFSAVGSRPGR